MMLVSMSDPGLIILPTHRLVSGIPALTADRLRTLLQDYFHLETVGQDQKGARETWSLIEADSSQELLGFGTVADGIWQTARFIGGPTAMAQLAPQHCPQWRELAVSLLHVLVLGKLLLEGSNHQPECRYVHLLEEVNEAIAKKQCQLAVLVTPATMRHVEQIAGQREKMPPKSTYFYPKLLSGLVFNPLTGS
jgi:uncharacterized protein (DUF1015 family)